MTVAILYARYSTVLQSQASVEDQFRLLRDRAEREGWAIAGECADRAISGTVRDRPGLVEAMAAIEGGSAQVLLAESLDRLSRDQEDLANLFKRVRFAGGRIVTASEGEIGVIHIGMGGTMSALFLEQLGEKVRRGHVGRVRAGRIPGGISYGYRKTRAYDDQGEPERGLREIDPDQAAIVKRIFEDYAAGKGPADIARALNAEGIPAPRGGHWRANAITGNRMRGNGILHNELYVGRIVYNRQTFRKDPETRKRVARPNDMDDRVVQEVPDLRIIDQETWDAVRARVASYDGKPLASTRRQKRLFSGLLRCGECGGSVIIVSTDRWGCSAYRQTGTCGNRSTVTDAVLQRRVWDAVRTSLLHPDVITAYIEEFRLAWAEERRRRIALRSEFDSRMADIEQREGRIADAILAGVAPETLKERAEDLARERELLREECRELPDIDQPIAHPAIIEDYRRQVTQLRQIASDDRESVEQARPLLKRLINYIEVSPRADGKQGTDLSLHGDLANLLGIASPEKTGPAKGETGENCMLTLVAGVGFEPTTFRL